MSALAMTAGVDDVAVIGAGPYGLAATAHLRADGVSTAVFGEPMASWERAMPRGMLLRSTERSSSISDPRRELTLDNFATACGSPLAEPLPVETFVAYGRWFQDRVAPDLDPRRVVRVERGTDAFRLLLEGGEAIAAGRVVVATGIASFAYRPPALEGLRSPFVVHSAELTDAARFTGRRVLVVGAGQSALESAALLHEAGASVEVLARAVQVNWIPAPRATTGRRRELLHELLYPPTEVGPPGLNWVAAAPDVFRRLPKRARSRIFRRCTLPVGAAWLRPRLADVQIHPGRSIVFASARNGGVRVTLDDGTRRNVDHVVAATGYRVAISRNRLLAPELLARLQHADGYPRLGSGFESSVPGLYFLGAAAARDYGPVMRFVAGTWFSAPALTRAVVGRPPAALSFSW